MKDRGFKSFVLSLYKPVKFLAFVMLTGMIISQILNLVKPLKHLILFNINSIFQG